MVECGILYLNYKINGFGEELRALFVPFRLKVMFLHKTMTYQVQAISDGGKDLKDLDILLIGLLWLKMLDSIADRVTNA